MRIQHTQSATAEGAPFFQANHAMPPFPTL